MRTRIIQSEPDSSATAPAPAPPIPIATSRNLAARAGRWIATHRKTVAFGSLTVVIVLGLGPAIPGT